MITKLIRNILRYKWQVSHQYALKFFSPTLFLISCISFVIDRGSWASFPLAPSSLLLGTSGKRRWPGIVDVSLMIFAISRNLKSPHYVLGFTRYPRNIVRDLVFSIGARKILSLAL
jgi:hypothetical protein